MVLALREPDRLLVLAGFADQQGPQTLVVLVAGRASSEMCPHPRYQRRSVGARALQFDVAVELIETLLAAQLGAGRARQPREQGGGNGVD